MLMSGHGVCSVVVTFGPTPAVLQNLAKLRPQVAEIVVVDNGSAPERLGPLCVAAQEVGFTVIENGANLGIGAALNIGIRWARTKGFRFVALFDQDSTVTEGFMQAMMREYAAHPHRDMLAVVTSVQIERSTQQARCHRYAKDGSPLVAITSGSLMPVEVFDRCGWFEENLIIDCVDHEYCLRARAQGYTLAESRDAVLMVAVGSASIHRLGCISVSTRHYSAGRRYYITRNRLVMIRRFWRQHPAWCCRTLQDTVQDVIKVALIEKQRWQKLKNTARGVYDAACGRMGKVVEL